MQHQFKLSSLTSLKYDRFSSKRFQDEITARLADSIQGSQQRLFHRPRLSVGAGLRQTQIKLGETETNAANLELCLEHLPPLSRWKQSQFHIPQNLYWERNP